MSGDQRPISERLVRRGEDEKAFDREFWRNAGPEARFEAAWQMVVESFLFQGKDPGELRLQRSVEALRKRERKGSDRAGSCGEAES